MNKKADKSSSSKRFDDLQYLMFANFQSPFFRKFVPWNNYCHNSDHQTIIKTQQYEIQEAISFRNVLYDLGGSVVGTFVVVDTYPDLLPVVCEYVTPLLTVDTSRSVVCLRTIWAFATVTYAFSESLWSILSNYHISPTKMPNDTSVGTISFPSAYDATFL